MIYKLSKVVLGIQKYLVSRHTRVSNNIYILHICSGVDAQSARKKRKQNVPYLYPTK